MICLNLRTTCATSAILVAGSLISACGSARELNSKNESAVESTDVNTGLIALGSGDARGVLVAHDPSIPDAAESDTSELVNQAAVDLERILAEGLPRRKVTPTPEAMRNEEASVPLSTVQEIDAKALSRADEEWNARAARELPSKGTASADTAEPSVAVATDVENDEKLIALAARIAELLRERSVSGEAVISNSVAFAMIEAYDQNACANLDDPNSSLRRGISEEDATTLIAARDAATKEDRAPKVEDVRQAIATVALAPQLRISDAKLCTKVSGFGSYTVFASNAFPAGKSSKAIVYTAVEGFESRPAVAGDPLSPGTTIDDQVSVELEQSLTLYQDQDDYQVWHRPAQRVVETARAKRRDFYLVQIIEFGSTLAPGRYNLKIRLKDRTNGFATESVIPVDIVRR